MNYDNLTNKPDIVRAILEIMLEVGMSVEESIRQVLAGELNFSLDGVKSNVTDDHIIAITELYNRMRQFDENENPAEITYESRG